MDLLGLVRSGNVDDFLYFYAFFRRAAFDDGELGVGALLAESTDYAKSVGDSLKVQVYEALRHVAQGFLDVVLHRDDAGKLYEIEVVGHASKVFDLSRLEVEGLPVGVSPASRQERKAV